MAVNNDALEHLVPGEGTPRREFLRTSLLLAAPLALGAFARPAASASRAVYAPISRARGTAYRNVRDYGARGDGRTDDTAAIQAAINSLPSTGGTVHVPAGTYMIDAVVSVKLRSRMHLELAHDAILKALPNGAEKAYVVLANKVTDVEISGGQLIGERYEHLVTTGEWGHAIFIRGSQRVTIRDLRCADCYGDGISLGAAPVWQSDPIYSEDVVIANVVSTNNRRQALTVGRSKYVEVHDSEFSGSHGVKPETGIDIEPDLPDEGGVAYRVRIRNCVIRNNKTYGINIWKGAKDITIQECVIEENGSCGLVMKFCSDIKLYGNTVRRNSATGIVVDDATERCTIENDVSYGNYARLAPQNRAPFWLTGWDPKIERDILVRGTIIDLKILRNNYR